MEQERTLPVPTVDEFMLFTAPKRKPAFIPTRYPHTYGYDFIRNHPDVVPNPETYDVILNCATGNGGTGYLSRADAAQLVYEWRKRNGWDLAQLEVLIHRLADAYLLENGIEKS